MGYCLCSLNLFIVAVYFDWWLRWCLEYYFLIIQLRPCNSLYLAVVHIYIGVYIYIFIYQHTERSAQ